MDSTIVNIRIFSWHFMIDKNTFKPSLKRNDYHAMAKWPDGYFTVYRFFNYWKKM